MHTALSEIIWLLWDRKEKKLRGRKGKFKRGRDKEKELAVPPFAVQAGGGILLPKPEHLVPFKATSLLLQ